ncbi:cytochrome c biogenesis protein DipZ [Streptacidiphilus sp. N1-12]|uniref:Cytochrome c biogenesis protein DipZ n=2 Tax=Streptacidiphilus alkalitolerans TaxID=3342712 RepID=A0ABV6V354_9ACTN
MITLLLIGFVGGLITGISPCILPVLPVIFLSGGVQGVQADRRRPYLVVLGLTLSFAAFTLVGTLLLSALPLPQDIIRWAGLTVLVLLGAGMLFPQVEALLERPFARIPQRRVAADRGAFVLGLALGAVYVPCAGPVLAAITVAGATGRIGADTLVLTMAFAVGTALPLLAFALAGRGIAERLRWFRSRQRGIRIGAGVVVIALAVALTFHVTDAVQRAIPDYTSALNRAVDSPHSVAKALAGQQGTGSGTGTGSDDGAGAGAGTAPSFALSDCVQGASTGEGPAGLQDCGPAPALSGIQQWLNTPGDAPVSLSSLKGKVVLIDFWAYSCINCQRAITHVNAWYSAYRADGLEVIGVHTPEYAFEHVPGNVAAGAKRLGIGYPVALDNNYKTWNSFGNQSWPADYLIDSTGTVRHVGIGEGNYAGTELLIRQLLSAADPGVVLPHATDVADTTPTSATQTPETYLGAARADNYAGRTPLTLGTKAFAYTASVPGDAFTLAGSWTVSDESLTAKADAGITLSFEADEVYLDVGGTGTITATVDGKTTTRRVSGAPNIYTLVDRKAGAQGSAQAQGQGQDTLRVTLSPGLSAYSFTFG